KVPAARVGRDRASRRRRKRARRAQVAAQARQLGLQGGVLILQRVGGLTQTAQLALELLSDGGQLAAQSLASLVDRGGGRGLACVDAAAGVGAQAREEVHDFALVSVLPLGVVAHDGDPHHRHGEYSPGTSQRARAFLVKSASILGGSPEA